MSPTTIPFDLEMGGFESLLYTHAHMIVVVPNGCWIWIGADNGESGYGKVSRPGSAIDSYTHRVEYELSGRKIPPGLELDHLCQTPQCCNPEHLEPVTRRVNCLRGNSLAAKNARKTHCVNGHELVAGNLSEHARRRGWRRCLACKREDMRRRRAKPK